jgi:hypothetical protein
MKPKKRNAVSVLDFMKAKILSEINRPLSPEQKKIKSKEKSIIRSLKGMTYFDAMQVLNSVTYKLKNQVEKVII